MLQEVCHSQVQVHFRVYFHTSKDFTHVFGVRFKAWHFAFNLLVVS